MVRTGEAEMTVRRDADGEHIDVCIGAPVAVSGAKAHIPIFKLLNKDKNK